MKKLLAILSVVLFANQASAHELKGKLEVDRVYESDNFIYLLINNTYQGQSISCAVYDAEKKVLGASIMSGYPLASEMMISKNDYFNLEDVKYHACVSR